MLYQGSNQSPRLASRSRRVGKHIPSPPRHRRRGRDRDSSSMGSHRSAESLCRLETWKHWSDIGRDSILSLQVSGKVQDNGLPDPFLRFHTEIREWQDFEKDAQRGLDER